MLDSFGREIEYLRISITDRCNLRCVYCMPESGLELVPEDELLSADEIDAFIRSAVGLGIKKVRFTGGEPLMRRDVIEIVGRTAQIEGIYDISMTTNGTRLAKFAKPLFEAGLHRVNVSLDTVDPARYSEITRGGNLKDVLRGIFAAAEAGLSPIKVNCVISRSPREPDARKVADFCKKNGFQVRFIRRMELKNGTFWKVYGGSGGDCRNCNRIRLTCNGFVRPCLFNDIEFNARELGYKKALELAIAQKPERGVGSNGRFYHIGG